MRHLLTLLAVALLLGSDTPRVEETAEETPHGTWRLVSVQEPEREPEKVDEKFRLPDDFSDGNERVVFRYNASSKPKTIEWTVTAGRDKDTTYYGIYEFRGDTLEICVSLCRVSV